MKSEGIELMEHFAHLISLKETIRKCTSEYHDLEPHGTHCMDYIDDYIKASAERIAKYYAMCEEPVSLKSVDEYYAMREAVKRVNQTFDEDDHRPFYDIKNCVWRMANDDRD